MSPKWGTNRMTNGGTADRHNSTRFFQNPCRVRADAGNSRREVEWGSCISMSRAALRRGAPTDDSTGEPHGTSLTCRAHPQRAAAPRMSRSRETTILDPGPDAKPLVRRLCSMRQTRCPPLQWWRGRSVKARSSSNDDSTRPIDPPVDSTPTNHGVRQWMLEWQVVYPGVRLRLITPQDLPGPGFPPPRRSCLKSAIGDEDRRRS